MEAENQPPVDGHNMVAGKNGDDTLNVSDTVVSSRLSSNVSTGSVSMHQINDEEKPPSSSTAAALPPLEALRETAPLSPMQRAKVQHILAACQDNDLDALKRLVASPGGLVGDEIRRTAWPVLLGSSGKIVPESVKSAALAPHRDERQVELDVNRAFVYYPEESEERLKVRKSELLAVITHVLRRHPRLSYFQGFHDIAQVLLLVLGAEQTIPALARLSLLRVRDFMLPDIEESKRHFLLVPEILYAADKDLYRHISVAGPEARFFAMAATLTLYAHDIEAYSDIVRLFDYLLASEAVIPLYLYAQIILSRKQELLEIGPDEPEMLQFTLSKLPKPLELDDLIDRTQALYRQHPPNKLPHRAWSRVSAYSVLKTTRDLRELSVQTLEDGEDLFDRHASQIQWRLTRQHIQALVFQYRRPASWTGAAVLVAACALYYGRTTGTASSSLTEWSILIRILQRRAAEQLRYFAL